MKYFIAHMLTGEAKRGHDAITEAVSETFGLSRPTPAHITLKRPFDTDRIEDIEDVLEKFSKFKKRAPIKLKGFGNFGRNVLFVNVFPSPAADLLIRELDIMLKCVSWVRFGVFENPRRLHATIVHKKVSSKFNKVWRFVSKGSFEFDVLLSSITVLKKEGGIWTIHKQYSLK